MSVQTPFWFTRPGEHAHVEPVPGAATSKQVAAVSPLDEHLLFFTEHPGVSMHVVPSTSYPIVQVQLWPVKGATLSPHAAVLSPLALQGDPLQPFVSLQVVVPLTIVELYPVEHEHVFPTAGGALLLQIAPVSPWSPQVVTTPASQLLMGLQIPPSSSYPAEHVQEKPVAGGAASTQVAALSAFEAQVLPVHPS